MMVTFYFLTLFICPNEQCTVQPVPRINTFAARQQCLDAGRDFVGNGESYIGLYPPRFSCGEVKKWVEQHKPIFSPIPKPVTSTATAYSGACRVEDIQQIPGLSVICAPDGSVTYIPNGGGAP